MQKKWENIITKTLDVSPIKINSSLVSAQQRERLYWTNIGLMNSGLYGDAVSAIEKPKDLGIRFIDVLDNANKNQIAVCVSKQKRNNKHILESNFTEKSNVLTGFEHNSMVGIFKVDDEFYLSADDINKIQKYKGSKIFKTGNARGKMPFPNNLQWKSLCLLTNNGLSRVVNFVDDGFGVRRLTPNEYEKLQTVPINYTSLVSDSQRYKMLGNGWTVDVIAHIFSYLALTKL